MLRRLRFAGGRIHSTTFDHITKGLVTRITNDQPDPPWIGRIWDGRSDDYTLTLEPAGRAALQDAEAADGE